MFGFVGAPDTPSLINFATLPAIMVNQNGLIVYGWVSRLAQCGHAQRRAASVVLTVTLPHTKQSSAPVDGGCPASCAGLPCASSGVAQWRHVTEVMRL